MDTASDQTRQPGRPAGPPLKNQAPLHVVRPRTRQGSAADRRSEAAGAAGAGIASPPFAVAGWLATTCKLIPGIEAAAVFETAPATPPVLLAATPSPQDLPAVAMPGAARAAATRRCFIAPAPPVAAGGPPRHVIALPMVSAGHPGKVAVACVSDTTNAQRRFLARNLNQCIAWVPLLADTPRDASVDRPLLEVVAQCLGETTVRGAAMAVSTHLATLLGCERVSIAMLQAEQLRLAAISRHGSFDERASLSRSIVAAMEEALAQDATILHPAPADGARFRATQSHAALCQETGTGSACTVPMSSDGKFIGAVTFEHPSSDRFDTRTVQLCEAIFGFVGPILAAYHQAERSIPAVLRDDARALAGRVLGPRQIALKCLLAAAAIVLLVGAFVPGQYRVSAHAVLRGTVQRLAVSPIDGFVAEAPARAGDVVEEGQVLATLDQRTLQLERVRWSSERDRLLNEYRTAMAELDSMKVTILRSQLDRATAELTLADEQLARTRIVAPFAGVVVAGDLTQAIGAPVKKGDTLFEIAPLDSYRVMLEVDERDIGQVATGQQGRIVLSGFPGDALELRVERITPVSRTADGRNVFSVEAGLLRTPPLLRPGMQGVAKLEVGQRKLGWIWTHRAVEWLSLQFWRWFSFG